MDSIITLHALIERANMDEKQFANMLNVPEDCDITDFIDHPKKFSVKQAQRAYELLEMTPHEGNVIFFENGLSTIGQERNKTAASAPAGDKPTREDFIIIAQTWRKLYYIYDKSVSMRRSQASAGTSRRAWLETRLCDNRMDELHNELELVRRLDRVRGFIRQRPENEKSILFGRYMMGQRWTKIAKQVGFSVDHCYTLHRMALRHLEHDDD